MTSSKLMSTKKCVIEWCAAVLDKLAQWQVARPLNHTHTHTYTHSPRVPSRPLRRHTFFMFAHNNYAEHHYTEHRCCTHTHVRYEFIASGTECDQHRTALCVIVMRVCACKVWARVCCVFLCLSLVGVSTKVPREMVLGIFMRLVEMSTRK